MNIFALALLFIIPVTNESAVPQSSNTVEAIVQVIGPADVDKVSSLKDESCIAVHRVDLILITGGDKSLCEQLAAVQEIDHSDRLPFVKKIFLASQLVSVSKYSSDRLKAGDIIKATFSKYENQATGKRVIGYPRKKLADTFFLKSQQFIRNDSIETTRFGRVRGGNLAIVTGSQPGWLFRGRERYLWQYENKNLFSNDELARYKRHLQVLRDFLAKRGIKFYLVVIPSKFTVYGDYFPQTILKKSAAITRFEQVDAYIKDDLRDIWLNLSPTVIAARNQQENLIYYPLDHHWNYRGAYAGYKKTIEFVSRDFPVLSPLSWHQLQTIAQEPSEMSLAGMSNIETLFQESDVGVAFRPTAMKPQSSLHVALLADSFGWYFRPFFSYHFEHVFYHFANEPFSIDDAFLEREKPDVVIIVLFETILEQVFSYSVPAG
jgi:hypothetical protein